MRSLSGNEMLSSFGDQDPFAAAGNDKFARLKLASRSINAWSAQQLSEQHLADVKVNSSCISRRAARAKKRRAGSSRYCQSGVGETGQVERERERENPQTYYKDAGWRMKSQRSSTSIIGAYALIEINFQHKQN